MRAERLHEHLQRRRRIGRELREAEQRGERAATGRVTAPVTALQAARENYTYEAFLYELARQEADDRSQRRIARQIRESGLPAGKTFQSLQVEVFDRLTQHQLAQLRTGAFVREAIRHRGS